MENWKEIKHDIKEAMEEACFFDYKVKYFKPKDGDYACFKVITDDLCTSEADVESALEEVMEQHILEPEWERDGELNLVAYWDNGESDY